MHSLTFPLHWHTSWVTFVWSAWDSESSFTECLLLPLTTGSCFSSRNKAEQQRQGRKKICLHPSTSLHHPATQRSRSLGAHAPLPHARQAYRMLTHLFPCSVSKFVNSNYTSDSVICACGLVSFLSILSYMAIILQMRAHSITRLGGNSSKVTEWEFAFRSPLFTQDGCFRPLISTCLLSPPPRLVLEHSADLARFC